MVQALRLGHTAVRLMVQRIKNWIRAKKQNIDISMPTNVKMGEITRCDRRGFQFPPRSKPIGSKLKIVTRCLRWSWPALRFQRWSLAKKSSSMSTRSFGRHAGCARVNIDHQPQIRHMAWLKLSWLSCCICPTLHHLPGMSRQPYNLHSLSGTRGGSKLESYKVVMIVKAFFMIVKAWKCTFMMRICSRIKRLCRVLGTVVFTVTTEEEASRIQVSTWLQWRKTRSLDSAVNWTS